MTDTEIKALTAGQTVWDDHIKGLHVRCLPSGAKSFLLYYRTRAGQQRRPKLGTYPGMTLVDARAAARPLLVEVAAGVDPRSKWDAERAALLEARGELTVAELFTRVWAEYWDKDRFWLSRWAQEVQYNYKNHLAPAFGPRKLSEITPPELRKWHRKYLETAPYAGNRSLEILSRMYNFAEEEGLRPRGSNPCTLVAAHKEKKRDRSATRFEVKRIGAVLEEKRVTNPCEAAFVYTLMFSGARPRSLERALKSELTRIEFQGQIYGLLTFAGKSSEATGEDERVIIPPHTLQMIDALPNPTEKLFPIKMPSAFWNKVTREAKVEGLWVRDWRKTFASIGLEEGITANILGEALNHKSYQTTKNYARLGHEGRIKAVGTIADQYKKMMGHE